MMLTDLDTNRVKDAMNHQSYSNFSVSFKGTTYYISEEEGVAFGRSICNQQTGYRPVRPSVRIIEDNVDIILSDMSNRRVYWVNVNDCLEFVISATKTAKDLKDVLFVANEYRRSK